MSEIPKITLSESERLAFHDFLGTHYGTTYSKWLCIVEPTRTAIYDSFSEYKVNGRFISAAYSPEKWFFGKGDGRKIFSEWLRKSSAISYDCFLSLSLELKQRIYREFCNSSEARIYFSKLGESF